MLDNVADAITVQSPDHKLIYANQAAARYYGIPRRRGAGRLSTRRRTCGASRPRTSSGARWTSRGCPAGSRSRACDPEPVIVRSRDRETGEVRWARIKATAVHDPDGGVRLAINVIEDITELKRSEEAQRFLAEASRRLSGSSLDYERTLAAVAELAVPALADRVRRRPGRRATATVPGGGARGHADGRGVARAGADDRADDRRARDRDADAVGRPARVYDAAGRARGRGLRRCARARRWRTRGSTARPRRSRARCRPRCCRRACPTSRARRWRPRSTPPAQGLEVGGDFYDVFTTGEGQWYLVIGDVCGKGAEAAAVTALARYTLRTRRRAAALTGGDPALGRARRCSTRTPPAGATARSPAPRRPRARHRRA